MVAIYGPQGIASLNGDFYGTYGSDYCRDVSSGFLRPEKVHRPQPDLNPRTSDLEASTLPHKTTEFGLYIGYFQQFSVGSNPPCFIFFY